MMEENQPFEKAVVVGGTKGIGLAIVEELARTGFRDVVVVGRDEVAGGRLQRERGVRFLACDVSSMGEVARLGRHLSAEGGLDLLIHCADVLAIERRESADGIELSFATNYLSRAFLNHLLDASLRSARAPTVVHVAAAGMPGRLRLEDLPPLAPASSFTGHNTGQRANDVYGLELATRLAPSGGRVLVFNPGLVDTEIRRKMGGPWWSKALVSIMEAVTPTTDTRTFAQMALRLAVVERAPSGLYDAKGRPIREKGFRSDVDFRRQIWVRTEATWRALVRTERP